MPVVILSPPGNDFAILKLSRSARLGPSVMPACLPDPRVALETGRNARCYMAGWGTDDNARGKYLNSSSFTLGLRVCLCI